MPIHSTISLNHHQIRQKDYEPPEKMQAGHGGEPKKEKPKPNRMGTRSGNQPKTGSPGARPPLKPTTPTTLTGKHVPPGNDESNSIRTFLQKLDTKLDNLDGRLISSMNELKEKIEASKVTTERTAEDCAKVKDATNRLKVQVSVHGARLSALEAKIEQLERDKRKNTLVIDGVEEIVDEDVGETVENLFKEVGVSYSTRVCINIYRRGKRRTDDCKQTDRRQKDRVRPILVVFLRQTEKSEFFRCIKNLKGNDLWRNVYFNDDLTEIQANEQRDLRSLAAYAKSQGKEAGVRGGAPWYENRKYRYDELHILPPGISLLKAKTLEILDGKAIIFQSPHSPLSNLYHCNIVFRGESFVSAEGAFHYKRALTSCFEQLALEIKST